MCHCKQPCMHIYLPAPPSVAKMMSVALVASQMSQQPHASLMTSWGQPSVGNGGHCDGSHCPHPVAQTFRSVLVGESGRGGAAWATPHRRTIRSKDRNHWFPAKCCIEIMIRLDWGLVPIYCLSKHFVRCNCISSIHILSILQRSFNVLSR